MRGVLLAVIALSGGRSPLAQRAAPEATIPVELRPAADLPQEWKPVAARIVGNIGRLSATAQIKYSGEEAAQASRFYGQFFDAQGRRCFTLIFGLGAGGEGGDPTWVPGQIRSISAETLFLLPASEPRRLVIGPWSPLPADAAQGSGGNLGKVDAPPTLRGDGAALDWERVWLGPEELAMAEGPVLDVVLARVSVGSDGQTETFRVLEIVDASVGAWFENLMSHLKWRPALSDGRRSDGVTLLLVRAGVIPNTSSQALPWASPWVRAYVAEIRSGHVPAVNEIILDSEGVLTGKPNPKVPTPGYFQYDGLPTLWSQGPTDGRGHWSVQASASPQGAPSRLFR